MNHVDALLAVPFQKLAIQDKKEVKRLGPHQPLDFKLKQHDGRQNRFFSTDWYRTYEWLTVHEENKTFFCFYCLLFTEDSKKEKAWSRLGFTDLKKISEKLKLHSQSSHHINCSIAYKLFGTVDIGAALSTSHRLSIERHNQEVDNNRHVLGKIIEAILFCGVHELPLRGHDESEDSSNRGVFLDLLNLLSDLDVQLHKHLETATVARYTSNTIQNELLDCVYEVYIEHLKSSLNTASFISVSADETTDISCRSQFVITLRFIEDQKPVERFLKFVDVKDRTAVGLSSVIKAELNRLQIPNFADKLIAQTYDGASVMSGTNRGVQALLREAFPYAHFIHCYAHQANIVLKKLTSHIQPVRLFFANITGFSTFFSVSCKRSDALRDITDARLPRPSETRWNFQSRLIGSVYENKEDLIKCFEQIENSDVWDDLNVKEAFGLRRLLEDETFVYFLKFFNDIFFCVDILFNTFQSRTASGIDATQAVSDFCKSVQGIRDKLPPLELTPGLKRRHADEAQKAVAAAKEVCDTLTSQLSERFGKSKLVAAFTVVDPKKFTQHASIFPREQVNTLKESFPFLQRDGLENELKALYTNETFAEDKVGNVSSLHDHIIDIGLTSTFPEVLKVVRIVLTTPVSSAEPERCFSTLKRVKTYIRNSMGQDRLNALGVLAIHKEEFLQKNTYCRAVLEKFACMKDRRAKFLYK